MKTIFSRRPRAMIPLLCYGAAAAVWLLLCTALLVSDTAARLTGRLTAQAMELSEFELIELECLEDGELRSVGENPRMIWYNTTEQVIRTVYFSTEDPIESEVCIYYTEYEGQDYNNQRRIFPQHKEDGSYFFTLPHTALCSFRLDPGNGSQSYSNIKIVVNASQPAWRYFIPSWQQLFNLLLYPGLVASALNILQAASRNNVGYCKPEERGNKNA